MGGYPPSLFWEASEAKNGPKIAFFEKIIAAFRTCGLAKVLQIAVFLLRVFFWVLQKHCKYQCFGSILGLPGSPKTS